MKIIIIGIGKTGKSFLEAGEREYMKRLNRYTSIEVSYLPDVKNAKKKTVEQIKEEEGEQLLAQLKSGGLIVLLDEKGKQYTSVEFADWMQSRMNRGLKHITFVIGGPYGFSSKVLQQADEKVSFSKMTFSHQMIRMLFLEQLYRGFSILRNEPYHHE